MLVEYFSEVGSPSISVQASGHDLRAQQVEAGSPVHRSLDEL